MPTMELPPAIPFTPHAMLAPAARQNDAVNVCAPPSPTLAEEGEIKFVAAHVTVALALPNFEPSAALVAITVAVAGEGGAVGAVYTALAEPLTIIVPTTELPPAIPFTLHVTFVVGLPVAEMFAVNTCAPPVGIFAVLGKTVTAMSSLRLTTTEALACKLAWLTAVNVTLAGDGMIAGAVYSPVTEIVPVFAAPAGTPFTSHVTLAFELPGTLA